MYTSPSGLTLGFHGCDKEIADKVLSGKIRLSSSTNSYDWLGNGIYFWENNPARALDYAKVIMKHPERVKNPIKKPAVIGVVLNLGHCLNLLESDSIKIVKEGHNLLRETLESAELEIPVNMKNEDGVPLLRHLDCAVIEAVHQYRGDAGEVPFDSVRAMFTEGRELYDGAGFQEKNHVQICVRNPNCIKGYFRVLESIHATRGPSRLKIDKQLRIRH